MKTLGKDGSRDGPKLLSIIHVQGPKLGELVMTQTEKLVHAFKAGQELTAKQIGSQFNIGSPSKVISLLRENGYSIYLNKRVDTKGRVTHKYRLGTPKRSFVALAVQKLGARAFA